MKPKRSRLCLQKLETRDAPATLVSATKLTYQDIDGDNVTVTLSKPLLNPGNVNSVFVFDVSSPLNLVKQQLQTINLTGLGVAAAGINMTVTATRSAVTGGDGQANVGFINATGIDLGPVSIAGDLGRIIAGDSDPAAPALKSLTVRSMGRFGTDTQASGGDLRSDISGSVGALAVRDDIVGAAFTSGAISSVTIGGSLIGGVKDDSGSIFGQGGIGVVKVGGNLQGAAGKDSGRIGCRGLISNVFVGGSLIGGLGDFSGTIATVSIGPVGIDMGPVTIGHDVLGGSGRSSGGIHSSANLGAVRIGGSLVGANGDQSGQLLSDQNMGAVRIDNNVTGGAGGGSGKIDCEGDLKSVVIGGSVTGGSNGSSGLVFCDDNMGPVTIGHDVIGGAGDSSGMILSGRKLAGVTILGSLVGGSNEQTGAIRAGDIGPVKIGHDVKGATGHRSGSIVCSGTLASVTIGGSLFGAEAGSGEIDADSNIGSVFIGHDVVGGFGEDSGAIESFGPISSLTVKGSIVGGSGKKAGRVGGFSIGVVRVGHDVAGGSGDVSGAIASGDVMGNVFVGGSVIGGTKTGSGIVSSAVDMGAVKIAHDVQGGTGLDSGIIFASGKIASVSVGGALIGGASSFCGSISCVGDMGPVTIGHDVRGGSGESSGLVSSQSRLARIIIVGSLISGSNKASGEVFSQSDMGPVKIGGSIVGGSSDSTGLVRSLGSISDVSVAGSVVGGLGGQSGGISATNMGAVRIGHDLIGASISGTASDVVFSGFINTSGRTASVLIGGSIISGTDTSSGGNLLGNATVRAGDDIGSLTVVGSVIGNLSSPVIITARGQHAAEATSDVAIGRIAISGRVEFAKFQAGYDTNLVPRNADAQIGPVTVGSDWIASTFVAGVADGGNGFGISPDTKISAGTDTPGTISKIASIAIGGLALGTPNSVNSTDSFGFVAQQIGALKVNGFAVSLTAGAANDLTGQLIGVTNDLRVLEVGL